ncbi:hypothetical protein ACS8YF_16040 [Salinisphaera sp. SWV1]|uniref:hypothetical protein n=1 Tax=Salinisphaera sp. SWV1 TaxID=3454139 RepID=UPI003F828019
MPEKSAEITRQQRARDAVVTGAGVRLACYTDGDPSRPTLGSCMAIRTRPAYGVA